MIVQENTCPGCGLKMPKRDKAYNYYYNASSECWEVYTEVLASEYSNAFVFGRVHQLTVDTYAVQHAGAQHPDKSVVIHLIGLHLTLVRGMHPMNVPSQLQRLAGRLKTWPHFSPPAESIGLTIFDVALSESDEDHIKLVRDWSGLAWKAWSQYHSEIADLVSEHLMFA